MKNILNNLFEHKNYIRDVIKLQLEVKRVTIIKTKIPDELKEYFTTLLNDFLSLV